jgi:cytochrome c oxidase assembly protein subunit 15
MNRFQKLAAAALVSVLVLIFVGATVRVTGAGLGCPDWPLCWGSVIPPWKLEQVDLEKIDFEKFQRKAERLGRDPATVTPEKILESFNPRHVWTEFVNRLASLPVGLFSLATFVAAFGRPRGQRIVWWTSLASLILVGVNAVMGARVVYSGVQPGILTLHMALAMLLIALLAFTVWRGSDRPRRLDLPRRTGRRLSAALAALLGLIVIEGIMGTQIRELTDAMAKSHESQPRAAWIGELESHWIYLTHRSFSWVIVALALGAWWAMKRALRGKPGAAPKVVVAMVVAQMILGLIMSQVEIYAVVQVLHVGLSGVLLAAAVMWWCQTWAARGRVGVGACLGPVPMEGSPHV